ncbi:pilus assembly protein TadE [Grimontia hollisae]|nr:pilus assembly protein TadE [Grimontia hollisae]AMG29410.1 pilus assembly protein TadE [Grimontia hollisae]MDF2184574.1 pilus assembly protein [Grimontia hollisae]
MMRKNNRPNVTQYQKGVVSIEFSIGVTVLFYALFAWVEICTMGFISSVVDYAIAESSRAARTSANADYDKLFKDALANSDHLWTRIVDPEKFTVSVSYFDSFSQASDINAIGGVVRDDMPIALYRISYDYSPTFAYFFDNDTVTLSREVFALQEFERDQFSQ